MQEVTPEVRHDAYAMIRATVATLDSPAQPRSPAQVAAHIGVAPQELARELERWSGLPAQGCLALLAPEHAAWLLATRPAALRPGTTPATVFEPVKTGRQARGAGLAIAWAVTDSPFGPALTMATRHGICAIGFTDETGEEAALADLQDRWPAAEYRHDAAPIAPLAAAAFRADGPLPPLHLIGAPFQLRVWKVLLRIPRGEVTTYSAIADAIGRPAASRAVGTAVGRNPVSLLVPCHRVLRRNGAMGGYHWGLSRKRAMLARESAHYQPALAA